MPKAKKKDFNKAKLKVGKTKAQATSFTDTSFQTKTIQLRNQSIAGSKGGSGDDFDHYLLLCKHHSATTRKEAVIYLKSQAHAHLTNIRPLFAATAPLILDGSKSVRDAVHDLYSKTPEIHDKLSSHISLIMLYVHSAMTHINPEIRAQSASFLDVLLDADPHQVIRKSWTKTIQCFMPLLGWEASKSASSSVNVSLSYGSNTNKVRTGHLQSLQKLLSVGLSPNEDDQEVVNGPHADTGKFMLPTTPMPFLHVGLFRTLNSSGSTVTEDSQSRLELLSQYSQAMKRGLEDCCKEAGQIGRVSSGVLQLLSGVLS